jgi:hypothetical protein
MKHIKSMVNKGMPKILEIVQSSLAGFGFYFAYVHYAQNEYVVALHILIIFVVIPLAGFTGLGSVLFSDAAAKAKGREVGSAYQIQSGMNNLAVAITAIIILYFKWGVYAELSVLFVSLIFFSLSAINHAVEFFKQGNKKIIHLMRPIFSLLLVLASLPIIMKVL